MLIAWSVLASGGSFGNVRERTRGKEMISKLRDFAKVLEVITGKGIDHYNCGEEGNCYFAAYTMWLDMVVAGDTDALVCHGRGYSDLEGGFILHAWVESHGLFLDASHVGDSVRILPAGLVYQKHAVDGVRRYNGAQLIQISKWVSHTGPWFHSGDTVEDEDEDDCLVEAVDGPKWKRICDLEKAGTSRSAVLRWAKKVLGEAAI